MKKSIPASYARAIIGFEETWEIMINLAVLPAAFSSFTTWTPSFSGIRKSTRTTSGFNAMISSVRIPIPSETPLIFPRS